VSYRDPERKEFLTRGLGCGCLSAIAVIVVAWPLIFAFAWNCAHRIPGTGACNSSDGTLLLWGMITVATATFWLVRRHVERADRKADLD